MRIRIIEENGKTKTKLCVKICYAFLFTKKNMFICNEELRQIACSLAKAPWHKLRSLIRLSYQRNFKGHVWVDLCNAWSLFMWSTLFHRAHRQEVFFGTRYVLFKLILHTSWYYILLVLINVTHNQGFWQPFLVVSLVYSFRVHRWLLGWWQL